MPILHILQLNLVVYLIILEVNNFFHYLLLYLVQQQLVINVILILFSHDEGTPSPIPASDTIPYPTTPLSFGRVLTPDPISNDIFKKIKSDGIPIGTAIVSVNTVNNSFRFFDFLIF